MRANTPDRIAAAAAGLVVRAAARVRRELLALCRRYPRQPLAYIPAAEQTLRRAEPHLARAVRTARVLATVRASAAVAAGGTLPPRRPPVALAVPPPGDPDPVVLPAVQQAVGLLVARRVYSADDFARLDAAARTQGFTVAQAMTADAAARVRDALAENLREGRTLRDFWPVVDEALGAGALSAPQVETVYRTEMGRAVTAGQMAVLDRPLVADQFPYLLYTAVHDSRVRPEHLQLERLGLDGTAVYRRDDPIWSLFLPPWAWNCRCHVIPIDVETAAESGVGEARRWLRTGRSPAVPQYAAWPPFRPDPRWVPVSRAG